MPLAVKIAIFVMCLKWCHEAVMEATDINVGDLLVQDMKCIMVKF